MKRIILIFLMMCVLLSVSFCGVASVADDAVKAGVKIFIRVFGDDGAKIAAKYGDDVVSLFGKYGDDGVRLLSKYGDDAAKVVAKYGDDGARFISKYGDDAIKLYGKYGDDAIKAAVKYGDDGVELVGKYGDDMARLLSKSDVPIDLIKKAPDDCMKVAKTFSGVPLQKNVVFNAAETVGSSSQSAFLEKAAHYGSRTFDYIKKNPGLFVGMGMTAAFAKAITDPEIAKNVTEPVLSQVFSTKSPIAIAIGLGIFIFFGIYTFPKIYKGIRSMKKDMDNGDDDE
jgi:hypothetical protein